MTSRRSPASAAVERGELTEIIRRAAEEVLERGGAVAPLPVTPGLRRRVETRGGAEREKVGQREDGEARGAGVAGADEVPRDVGPVDPQVAPHVVALRLGRGL